MVAEKTIAILDEHKGWGPDHVPVPSWLLDNDKELPGENSKDAGLQVEEDPSFQPESTHPSNEPSSRFEVFAPDASRKAWTQTVICCAKWCACAGDSWTETPPWWNCFGSLCFMVVFCSFVGSLGAIPTFSVLLAENNANLKDLSSERAVSSATCHIEELSLGTKSTTATFSAPDSLCTGAVNEANLTVGSAVSCWKVASSQLKNDDRFCNCWPWPAGVGDHSDTHSSCYLITEPNEAIAQIIDELQADRKSLILVLCFGVVGFFFADRKSVV